MEHALREITELLKRIIESAWPLAILAIVGLFYRQLAKLLTAFTARLESDDSVKIFSIQLSGIRGVRIVGNQAQDQGADVFHPSEGLEMKEATEKDFRERQELRYSDRLVRLVHTVSVTGDVKYPLKVLAFLKTEKVLPDLHLDDGYKCAARLNDIDRVEYYLGKFYGRGDWGSWFTVKNVENNFAIEYFAEDEVNCTAKVHFHNGEPAVLRRYLDLEMGPIVTELDRNVKAREARVREFETAMMTK